MLQLLFQNLWSDLKFVIFWWLEVDWEVARYFVEDVLDEWLYRIIGLRGLTKVKEHKMYQVKHEE